MRHPRTLADWLRFVESSDVPEWVKRVLREYAARGRGGRMMSRPRRDVARILGISDRQVSKAIQRAKEAGLIVVVTRGVQGRTAVYQGTFGTPTSMGELGEPLGDESGHSGEVHPNDHRQFLGSPHKYPTTPTESTSNQPQEREEVANREAKPPPRFIEASPSSLSSPSLCWNCRGALTDAGGWCGNRAHRDHGAMHAAMVLVSEELGGVDVTASYVDG